MVNAPLGAVARHIRRLRALEVGRPGSDGELIAAFSARNEEAAFADIVRGYGLLVLGVCRRVLRSWRTGSACPPGWRWGPSLRSWRCSAPEPRPPRERKATSCRRTSDGTVGRANNSATAAGLALGLKCPHMVVAIERRGVTI